MTGRDFGRCWGGISTSKGVRGACGDNGAVRTASRAPWICRRYAGRRLSLTSSYASSRRDRSKSSLTHGASRFQQSGRQVFLPVTLSESQRIRVLRSARIPMLYTIWIRSARLSVISSPPFPTRRSQHMTQSAQDAPRRSSISTATFLDTDGPL